MSVLHSKVSHHIHNNYIPNGVQSNFASSVQLCFTCTKIRALHDCTSVVLECQGLSSNTETKSNILQVICQLLRVQWESLESLSLDDTNLPFCASCLKAVTEIIILREKLFQIETEIRQKLSKFGESVAICVETNGSDAKKTPEESSIEYDDLRFIFQNQVMEEHSNKKLLHQKILEMNRNPTACATESMPSMIQFQFKKNVFSIVDKRPKLEAIDSPVILTDASTDTKDFEIFEETATFNNAILNTCDEDNDMPPVLEPEVTYAADENFTFIPVRHDPSISDDSDYGSPSKKSKTDVAIRSSATLWLKKKPKQREFPTIKRKIDFKLQKKSRSKKSLKSELSKSHSRKVCPRDPLLDNNKTNAVPCSSKTMLADSGEEFDDVKGDGSDCILDNLKSDALESTSSESDSDEQEPDANQNKDAEDTVSISELCKKHTFKPKHSRRPISRYEKPEHTFVKVIQEEATFTAKDKTIWTTKEPNQIRQTRAYEILREKGGLVGPAKDTTLTPTEIFKLMFPPTIVETIVKHTNAYATYVLKKKQKKNGAGVVVEWSPITIDEMYAYIGILLYLGADNKRNTSYIEAWSSEELRSTPTIAATMASNRFSSINSFLRFDDKVARMSKTKEPDAEEDEESKYSYISEVFEPFVENMEKHLRPYDTLIVDEMLVKFRGSAKFRVYMKSKPGKFGMKLWAVCDVETGYVLKISLYQGKVDGKTEREHGRKVVLNLVKKYFGSGRGVTMDNFFTSKALGEELIKQKMSMLGTLNHKRMDVIPKFVDPKGREELSSVFAFQGDFTMVSYVPKKNRAVLLLSTQHHSAEISSHHRYKPRMILDYNMTKAGVDTADQMIAKYSCQRQTARWPVKIFHALLDIAGLNANTIFRMHNSSTDISRMNRKAFLRSLSEGLMEPLMSTRLERNPGVRSYVLQVLEKLGYEKVVKVQIEETMASRIANAVAGATGKAEVLPQRGHCTFCARGKRTTARQRCTICKKFLCKTCRVEIIHCRTPGCTFARVPAPKKGFNSV